MKRMQRMEKAERLGSLGGNRTGLWQSRKYKARRCEGQRNVQVAIRNLSGVSMSKP